MQTSGKFVLFTLDEFDSWLRDTAFSRTVKVLQNHHTLEPAYVSFKGHNHFALLKGMEEYHMKVRGFEQIAQNLTTFPDGTVALCRPIDRIPAGIKGANQGGICIEHLGNFDTGRDSMTPEHVEAISKTNALLCREFCLTPSADTIVYHHWYDLDSGSRTNGSGNTKSCPGSAFFGGNTVSAAQGGFIPLVAAALESLTATAPPAAATPMQTAEVTAFSLNVRSGPGASNPVVKSLGFGVQVGVYETVAGWRRIHPTRQQWVNGRFLHNL